MLRHDYRRAAALYDSALMIVPNIISTARVRASYYKAKALAEVREAITTPPASRCGRRLP